MASRTPRRTAKYRIRQERPHQPNNGTGKPQEAAICCLHNTCLIFLFDCLFFHYILGATIPHPRKHPPPPFKPSTSFFLLENRGSAQSGRMERENKRQETQKEEKRGLDPTKKRGSSGPAYPRQSAKPVAPPQAHQNVNIQRPNAHLTISAFHEAATATDTGVKRKQNHTNRKTRGACPPPKKKKQRRRYKKTEAAQVPATIFRTIFQAPASEKQENSLATLPGQRRQQQQKKKKNG